MVTAFTSNPLEFGPLDWIVLEAADLQEAYPGWVQWIRTASLKDNEMVGYRNLELYRRQLYEKVCSVLPEVAKKLRYVSRAGIIPLHEWRSSDNNLLDGLLDELGLIANEARVAAAESPRLVLDLSNNTVKLDRESYALDNETQSRVLKCLIEAEGGWVSGAGLKEFDSSAERPDRIIKHMPAPIQECIESKRGTGSRLTVAAGIIRP